MFNLGQLISHETKERIYSAVLEERDVISKKRFLRIRRERRIKHAQNAT